MDGATGRQEQALIAVLVGALGSANAEGVLGTYGDNTQLDGTFDMRVVVCRFIEVARREQLL